MISRRTALKAAGILGVTPLVSVVDIFKNNQLREVSVTAESHGLTFGPDTLKFDKSGLPNFNNLGRIATSQLTKMCKAYWLSKPPNIVPITIGQSNKYHNPFIEVYEGYSVIDDSDTKKSSFIMFGLVTNRKISRYNVPDEINYSPMADVIDFQEEDLKQKNTHVIFIAIQDLLVSFYNYYLSSGANSCLRVQKVMIKNFKD